MLAFASAGTVRADENDAAVYERLCGSCHGFDPGSLAMQGPHLRWSYGRKAGSVRGFVYSEALRTLDLAWTDATLAAYLKDPRGYLPGTKKYQKVTNEQDLKRVIAFLKTTQTPPERQQ